MNVRPILFNTEMVKAILEGRKTQTRRIVKPQPEWDGISCHYISEYGCWHANEEAIHLDDCARSDWPIYPGDILWVREAWCRDAGRFMYRANYADGEKFYRNGREVNIRWTPSIHMPKEAARIFLHVKDVRIELLQDIDEEAAIAEGFVDSPAGTDSPLMRFVEIWDKTIKRGDLRKYGYYANPWVWAIEFERIEKPEGWCR